MSTRQYEGSRWRGHIHPPFECGICALPVKMRSLSYGLISTPDSMDLRDVTLPFVFPLAATGSGGMSHADMDDIVCVGDWAVGARYLVEPDPPGNCVESAVFHQDCFKAYQFSAGKERPALRYLWFEGLWRQPWNRSWTVQKMRPLPREGFTCSKTALSHVLRQLKMTNWADKLPLEIIQAIYDLSDRALLWKVARAVTVAFEWRMRGHDEMKLVPAVSIQSWKRGEELIQVQDPSAVLPLLHFTIDSQGISQIERIERGGQLKPNVVKQEVEYLITEEDELKSVNLAIKSGKARLHIPKGHPGFTTWDMPRPPPTPKRSATLKDSISNWVENGAAMTRMCGEYAPANRLLAAPLEGATGVSFIFDKRFLAYIHSHTPRQPIADLPSDTEVLQELGGHAMQQFERLTWVYLPLPPGEKILSISYASDEDKPRINRPAMIVKTRLAGTIFVGYMIPENCPCIPLGVEPDVLFTRLQVSAVSGVGAYSTKPVAELPLPDVIPPEVLFGHHDSFRLTSYASLDDVTRVDLIENPATGAFQGMMMYYANGAQRTIGQYKIGHHMITSHMKPACVCLSRAQRQGKYRMIPVTIATCSATCNEGHETHTRSNTRACYRIAGIVRAQFEAESITLRFSDPPLENVLPAMHEPY